MRAIRRTSLITAALVAVASITTALAGPASAASCPTVTSDGTVIPFAASGALWGGCNLAGAHLEGATLTGAFLSGTDLRGAFLTGANVRGANLTNARLDGADLTAVDLTGATVHGATLSATVTTGAVFAGASLLGADLTGATLAGADLRGLRATLVTGVPTSAPTGWGVHGGWFVGPGVAFDPASFPALDLHGADLSGADLDGAQLNQWNLRQAVLTGVRLHGTSLFSVDLTGATGITTALTSATTLWYGTTCPDGVASERHNGRSCQLALDTTTPIVRVAVPRLSTTVGVRATTTLIETGSGVEGYRERLLQAPTGTTAYRAGPASVWYDQDPRPYTLSTPDGVRTCVSLQVRDFAGHVSAWSRPACTDGVIDDTGGALTLAGSWRFRVSPGWIEASSQTTARRGDWVESPRSYSVRQVGVVALTCATCGSLAVYVGATKVGAFSLRSTKTVRRVLLLPHWTTPRRGFVRIVVTSPNGKVVRLDGLVVTSL